MEEIRFKGKLARQKGVRYIGSGYVKQDDGKEFILNGEDKVEIIPGSLTIENNPCAGVEDMKVHDVTKEELTELHELLTNTTIKYLADKGIKSVDEVHFGADNLQASTEFKEWTCFTDSNLVLYGYEDEQRKLIGESL